MALIPVCFSQATAIVRTRWQRSWRNSLWKTRHQWKRRKRRKRRLRRRRWRMRRIENQELAFADLQYIGFSSFSTIDSKRTEFGHLHNIIRFSFYCFFASRSQVLDANGGKKYTLVIFFWKKSFLSHPFPSLHRGMPRFPSLSSTVQCYFKQTVKRGLW